MDAVFLTSACSPVFASACSPVLASAENSVLMVRRRTTILEDASQRQTHLAEVSRTASKWLLVVQTLLTLAEGKRSEFWAGDVFMLLDPYFPATRKCYGMKHPFGCNMLWPGQRDAGLADAVGILAKIRDARACCGGLQGAVDAYAVISALIKGSRPSTANGRSSSKNLLRWWQDVMIIHCAHMAGINDGKSFFRVLDVAFGGQLLDNRELMSQMQQSFYKVLSEADGAFVSQTAIRGERRGWTRPRTARDRVPVVPVDEPDTASAAAASSVVDVAAAHGSDGGQQFGQAAPHNSHLWPAPRSQFDQPWHQIYWY